MCVVSSAPQRPAQRASSPRTYLIMWNGKKKVSERQLRASQLGGGPGLQEGGGAAGRGGATRRRTAALISDGGSLME